MYNEDTLTTGSEKVIPVNDGNGTIKQFMNMKLERGGYRLTVNTFNRGINSLDLIRSIASYFGGLYSFSVGVNNSLSIVFGVAAAITLGLYIQMASSVGLNGTISLLLETIPVLLLPVIALSFLLLRATPTVYQTPLEQFTVPIAVAVLTIPLMAFYGYRRYR